MNFPTSLRDRRHFFGPTHYSIANYCTETKNEMKPTFGDEYFLDNLHLIPDPLKKNLAETIITEEKMPPKNEFSKIDVQTNENNPNRTENSPLSGITNFLSGVLNVISSAMFSRRKQTDFSTETEGEMAVECAWRGAKSADENKIVQDEKCPNGVSDGITAAEMGDCRAAAAHCQNKLDQVRLLLSKPVPCTVRVKRRPRRTFVEPGSVEECFDDAFASDDFESLSGNPYLEYVSPYCYHKNDIHEISAPNVKTETGPLLESTDIVKNVPETETTIKKAPESACNDKKEELIASCEDKLSKLKALLQERKKKVVEPEPVIPVAKEAPKPKPVTKIKDKNYKNPNRCTDKRRKTRMRQNINNDMLFAGEINTDELSSAENSPLTRNIDEYIPNTSGLEYFDEISGRFHSTSVMDSEDSFQIVFNDSPRLRRPSDCESEDSFIVFDDSQDSCYTSNNCYTNNDVFGDSSDSDSCDSDSELSDSGCGNLTFRLSHSLSKSVGNLTDDSLYNNASEDEVDCSKVELTVCEKVTGNEHNTGLLIDSSRRQIRRNLPPKRVQFSLEPPKVHVMRVWAFAARQARAGHWERFALDRERFKRRIADVEVAVSWVLRPQHRSRVMFQRFMPWWNAQKRREIAEKKQKGEEERGRQQVGQEQVAGDETSARNDATETEHRHVISDVTAVLDPLQGVMPIDGSRLQASVIVTASKEVRGNPKQTTPDVRFPYPPEVKQGSNGDDEEAGDLVDILVSKDENLGYAVGKVQLDGKETVLKVHNSNSVGNDEVNSQTVVGANVESPKRDNIIKKSNTSDATKLQTGKFDSRETRDDIEELNNDMSRLQECLHRKETSYKEVDDGYSRKNVKNIEDCKNKQKLKNLESNNENDSKNTMCLLNQYLGNIKNNNDIRTENDRGTKDTNENNKIVPYNDKLFNDFGAQVVRNA